MSCSWSKSLKLFIASHELSSVLFDTEFENKSAVSRSDDNSKQYLSKISVIDEKKN